MNKEEIISQFIRDIWNQKELDKIPYYVYPEYHIFLDPADPWEHKTISHELFKERLLYSFKSFPDIYFEITKTISSDNFVSINWILTGSNTGPIGKNPATNKKIRTEGITIYHFNGELICGHSQIYNRSLVAQQLGFI